MKKVLKKFGKYLLLDRLAQGGMAEIYRAWSPSVDGGGRLIALKCVQPDFGEDPEFLQMFRSEIRVTMGLNHPNIVQLYDFGEFENRPFIAMELVEGKNLKQFTTRVLQKGQPMLPEFAAHLIQQVAAGLHYAHTYKDKSTGESLNIVHRDVSPQNLLISYGGNLKIIDFGIAKAASNRQSTRAGIIKGKPSYLSPEQIDGVALDGRSDLFSLGAVLWETLTGRKLFAGDTELAAVRMIEDCDRSVQPPSTLNDTVPRELDNIVLKALAKDREHRFKSGEEMQRALHRFIYSHRPDFDPSELGLAMQSLFKVEMEQEQAAVRALSVEAKELFAQTGGVDAPTVEASKAVRLDKPKTFTSLALEPVEIDLQEREQPKRKRQLSDFDYSKKGKYAKGKRSGSAVGKLVVFAALAAGVVFSLPYLSHLRSRGHQESGAQVQAQAPRQQPQARGALAAQVPVKLRIYPAGGAVQVLLDQRPVNPDMIMASVGVTSKLNVVKQGFKPFEQDVTAISASPVEVDAVLEPDTFGTLSLHTTPTAEARISSAEWVWVQTTPLERLKLPPGQYQIQLVNQLLGMKKNLNVTIEVGRDVNQDVNLDVVR